MPLEVDDSRKEEDNAAMEAAAPQPDTDKKQRPLWPWLVLYILIAATAGALVYYFVCGKTGGYSFW